MRFEDAVQTAIRKYYDGVDPEELLKVQEGEVKYTREYFDELEEELVPSKEKNESKKKEDEEVELDDLD